MWWLIIGLFAVAALCAVYVVYLAPRDVDREARELVEQINGGRAQWRAKMAAEAARIEELVARGELEAADIATSNLLLDLNLQGPPDGADVAAMRALGALTAGYAKLGPADDVGRGLDAFEANAGRLGVEATQIAVERLDAIAAVLDGSRDEVTARRAREVRRRLLLR